MNGSIFRKAAQKPRSRRDKSCFSLRGSRVVAARQFVRADSGVRRNDALRFVADPPGYCLTGADS